MGRKVGQDTNFWDTSILTALKRTRFSPFLIVVSFLVILLLSFLVPRDYQKFMFFFNGIPIIYTGLVYSIPRAIYITVASFFVHMASSWPTFASLLMMGRIQDILIEGIFIVVAYLLSCLFITKILINERVNQKKLLSLADLHAKMAKQLALANEQISDSYTNTIKALATAIDAKDPYTKGHSQRVTNYAVHVAKAMNLSDEEVQNIFYGAILHDIGKIGINESILSKPGPLTFQEFKEIKRHPEIGATILASIPFLEKVLPIVLHHHEYFNGQGYPAGLKGSEIPIGARIIAVVDAFDAITTDRPYRKGYSKRRALVDIMEGTGRQFDPQVVAIFSKIIDSDSLEEEPLEVAAGVHN